MKKQKKFNSFLKVFMPTFIICLTFISVNVSASPMLTDDTVTVKNLNTETETLLPNLESVGRSSELEGSSEPYIPGNADMFSARSIIGSDNRYKITNTTPFPYSAICYIAITYPDGATAKGSAWMYSKNAAVTAGHCVYSKDHGGWAKKITIYPGKNGSTNPYGYAYSTEVSAPQGWTKNNDTNYDWGVIKLDRNIGNSTGYFGAHWTSSSLKGSNVDITGYPGEKSYTMWKMNGNITASATNKISYTIDTTGGQSGCPVYWKANNHTVAVAIHTNGSSTVNKATRITKSMFDYFNTFR